MDVNVKLREATLGDILPKFEWQVIDVTPLSGFNLIVFRSNLRDDCLDWLEHEGFYDADYKLTRVELPRRDSLSSHAKSLCRILVEKHGSEKKINIIKDIRAVYGTGLKEAKELIEDYLAGDY